MLEWNALIGDWNHNEIKTFNIFHHFGFLEYCKKNAKKNAKDYAKFCEQLYADLHYCFWSKSEYEVVVTDWPTTGRCEKKIDVYDQIALNWDVFCNYVWSHAVELRRWDKLKALTEEEVNDIWTGGLNK